STTTVGRRAGSSCWCPRPERPASRGRAAPRRRPSWRDRASRCSCRSGYPGWCTARAPWRPDRRRPPTRRRATGARPRAGSPHRASGLVRDLDDQLPEILAMHELDERLGGVLQPVDDVLAVLDLALVDPAREALEAHAEALGEI